IKSFDLVMIVMNATISMVLCCNNCSRDILIYILFCPSIEIDIDCGRARFNLFHFYFNYSYGMFKACLAISCSRIICNLIKELSSITELTSYGLIGLSKKPIHFICKILIVVDLKDCVNCTKRASYIDSRPQGNPKPCAGNQGTQITVEDLFYNIATRRKALKSTVEEHSKIAEVVGRYAIHNAPVGFTLKKVGESSTDIRTPSNSTTVDNIRSIYGPSVAKELLEIKCEDDALKFKSSGYISNANYCTKKCIFLLFINHRLVDSTNLRKAIETIYSSYLPKNGHPFIYLSLEIEPHLVDVNVHPTKHEVHFLNEDAIIEKIQKGVETRLLGCNSSRTFYTQALLPGAIASASTETEDSKGSGSKGVKAEKKDKDKDRVYDHQMIRTDSRDQKLDKFLSKSVNESSSETDISENKSTTADDKANR
ncbi:unnamed protein product, partial [Meganyctiphanes norvegica]